MLQKRIKDLKKGEFFTLKPIEYPAENQVFIRGDYDKSDKHFYCGKFSDISIDRGFKGDKLVYVGFTF